MQVIEPLTREPLKARYLLNFSAKSARKQISICVGMEKQARGLHKTKRSGSKPAKGCRGL
jgi:hypothetical protein